MTGAGALALGVPAAPQTVHYVRSLAGKGRSRSLGWRVLVYAVLGIAGSLAAAGMLMLVPATTRPVVTGDTSAAPTASRPAGQPHSKRAPDTRTLEQDNRTVAHDKPTVARFSSFDGGKCANREEWNAASCTWGSPSQQRVLAVALSNNSEGLGNAIIQSVGCVIRLLPRGVVRLAAKGCPWVGPPCTPQCEF